MLSSNKNLIAIIAGVVAVCILFVGVLVLVKDDKAEEATTFASDPTSVAADDVNSSTVPAPEDSSVTATSTTVVAENNLKQQLLGKWTDSANMSGYEFFADGTVTVTYVNLVLPIVNLPVNGTANGVYTLEGDKLTTKFSIYSATIDDTFKVSIENNMLSLYDYEDFETATYTRVSSSAEATTVPGSTQAVVLTGLEGVWVNSTETMKYSFEGDGTIYVTVRNDDGSTSTYKGIYLKQEPSVIIQYAADGETVTEKYTYTVSGNTLSLTDEEGNISLFARSGAASSSSSTSSTGGLIGKWLDGANLSGYTFKEGGVVDVTYVNFTVPVVNMPINGTFTGTYSIDGDKITISYSVYGKAMNETYTYAVSDKALTLTNTTDGTVKSYVRQ